MLEGMLLRRTGRDWSCQLEDAVKASDASSNPKLRLNFIIFVRVTTKTVQSMVPSQLGCCVDVGKIENVRGNADVVHFCVTLHNIPSTTNS